MKILAIETATPGSSVALVEEREVQASASRVDRTGHASFLVPAIDFCFHQAGWVPADVEAVVVDVGPGLYTGLRVGLATAQALGAAFGIPVVPASSLDALAFEAATAHRKIWSVVDARRGQLAIASYRPVPGGVVKDGATELMTTDEFRATLVSEVDDSLVVGDAMALPDDLLRGIHRVKTGRPRYPSASSLAHVGSGLLDRGEVPRADEIRPLYLREPDVTINWEKLRREGPWDRP